MNGSHALSEKMLSQVEAATPVCGPEDALGHRDIWLRIGEWAPTTVKHALAELTRQGRVTREGTSSYWRYRRRAES